MARSGLGAAHLGMFPARATILGVIHRVILLGKYGIWGGAGGAYVGTSQGGRGPLRPSILPGVARDLPVQTGRRLGRDLPVQTGRRLGGQGAWHIGVSPAPRCPGTCPYKWAGVRAGICPHKRVGVWLVREPSISGPIRPGGLAPSRNLPVQTGQRLGGQGAWHMGAAPAWWFGCKVPRDLPVQTSRRPGRDLPIQTGQR